MAGVRVITDSACDLPDDLVARLGIAIVPLTIRFGSEEMLDRYQLHPDEFWRRCKAGGELPETAAPAPGAFQQAFDQAADDGCDAVVCVTLSAGVSATYQAAVAAAEAVARRLRVKVVDSRSVTLGQGLLCQAAAEMASNGAGVEEVIAALADLVPRARVYGVVDTLDHLQRGGRIGGAAALLGSLLSVKPVIQVKDGVVEQESRQRTRARSLEYLVSKAQADAPLERLAVANGAAQDIDHVIQTLKDVKVAHPLVVSDLGPVVGAHVGPGALGVCYVLAGGA